MEPDADNADEGNGVLDTKLHIKNQTRRSGAAIALTIAGSDSGGGAGIQADLKAFSALGVYGASVITAITAQNTCAVTAVHEVPTAVVVEQIRAVLSDLEVGAIKIGMLSSVPIIQAVAKELRDVKIPIVLDPVMVAKSGDRLLREDAISALRDELLPMATVLTPNIPEAADLLLDVEAKTEWEMLAQGVKLMELGAEHVLMKGGHCHGAICIDQLVRPDALPVRILSRRLPTKNTHGTGCTLSSALAACLARGRPVDDAFRSAHTYLRLAMEKSDKLKIGSGHGPVHHFHEVW